ncbi:MAG: phospholipase D family protein [Terriglobales bacterium]|jgi:hypothetical protein
MQILLSPNVKQSTELRDAYNQALKEAEELYIASAYLTDWDVTHKLGSACKRVTFVVGTNFGLTRKAAMLNVLRWMPKRGVSFSFGAVPHSVDFHPKVVAWKARSGKYYCIIGSSNLSKAGFSINYEANVLLQIGSHEFDQLRKWLTSVVATSVSEDWINNHYKEAPVFRRGKGTDISVLRIKPSDLPHGADSEDRVREKRQRQAAFGQIGEKIRVAARRCSQKKISRDEFWRVFWELWADHKSRLQGKGLEMRGKSAKWEESCGALSRILDEWRSSSSIPQLDQIVSEEIDHLAKLKNPTRGAWLSEMLCHYFPEQYPMMNKPVKKWLSAIKLRWRRGTTEGQRYTELARTLRIVVRDHHPAGARNLAELDGGIFVWARDRGLLKH